MRRRQSLRVLVASAVAVVLAMTAAPAQALSTPTVKLSGGPYLVVDVGPDLPGTANWSFTLQRRTSTGTWAKVGTYSTTGTTEVKKLAVVAGTYRVIVAARTGYTSKTSSSYAYIPKPVVRWSGGSALHIDLDPNLPSTGSWSVTLQRYSGGAWSKVTTYATQGSTETVTALVGSGTYRAVVAKRDRFPAYTSPSYAFAYNPSVPGPYPVTGPVEVTFMFGLSPLTATLYLPVAATGTAPLIGFFGTQQMPTTAYAGTATWLAQHGYAVVVRDGGGLFPVGSTGLVDRMAAALTAVRSDPALPVVDDTTTVFIGHGTGENPAIVATSRYAPAALAGIDPVSDVTSPSGLTVPMGFIGETLDSTAVSLSACVPSGSNYHFFYVQADAAVRAYAWTIAGAGFTSFSEGADGQDSLCQTPTASETAVLSATRTLLTAFLNRNVRGDTTQDVWLFGSRVGVAPLDIVTAEHKP